MQKLALPFDIHNGHKYVNGRRMSGYASFVPINTYETKAKFKMLSNVVSWQKLFSPKLSVFLNNRFPTRHDNSGHSLICIYHVHTYKHIIYNCASKGNGRSYERNKRWIKINEWFHNNNNYDYNCKKIKKRKPFHVLRMPLN